MLQEEAAFKTGSSASGEVEIPGAAPNGALRNLLLNIFSGKSFLVADNLTASGHPAAVHPHSEDEPHSDRRYGKSHICTCTRMDSAHQ